MKFLVVLFFIVPAVIEASRDAFTNSCGKRYKGYSVYPWHATLWTKNHSYIGAGVLIAEDLVLTAAHLVNDYRNTSIKIRLGERKWESNAPTDKLPYCGQVNSKAIIIHPQFKDVTSRNDVAVIRLNAVVPIARIPNINTACLPKARTAVNTSCRISGAFEESSRGDSVLMPPSDVRVYSQEICDNLFSQVDSDLFFSGRMDFLCVAGERLNPCKKDAGSSLICPSATGQLQITGLYSGYDLCLGYGYPAPFIDVFNYVDWITEQMSASSQSNKNIQSAKGPGIEDPKYDASGLSVSIIRSTAYYESVLGSGVLIAEDFALTAAHIISDFYDDPERLKVRVTNQKKQAAGMSRIPFVDLPIQSVVIHSNFSSRTRVNDIAVIYLKKIVPVPKILRITSLPTAMLTPGTRCWVDGRERYSVGSAQQISPLKSVDVSIVHRDECSRLLMNVNTAGFPLGLLFKGTNFICAGGEPGRSVCASTGGSPLVCESANESYQVFGFVAWDSGCGWRGHPDVYVDILNYVPWINQQMAARTAPRPLFPPRSTPRPLFLPKKPDTRTSPSRQITRAPSPVRIPEPGAARSYVTILTRDNRIISGGVLIARDLVLTAAHKVNSYRSSNFKLRLTGLKQTPSESLPILRKNTETHFDYFPASVAVHPDFDPDTFHNDIAVIRLDRRAPVNEFFEISVASPPTAMVAPGTRCWFNTWNKVWLARTNEQYFEMYLTQTVVPIVDPDSCEMAISSECRMPEFRIDNNSFMCAGGELGNNLLTTDGGEPLLCKSADQQYQVVGLLRGDLRLCGRTSPHLFVNVVNYVPWIKQQMAAMG